MNVSERTSAVRAAPTGLRLIIGYKVVKATVEIMAGATFFALGSAGTTRRLVNAAITLRHHATEAWSIALAEKLLDVSTARHVLVVALAVIVDGTVTAVEGWALYRGYSWSHWLVMLTTASLLPFEIHALTRHFTTGHVVLLVLNMLIVAYLLRHLIASGRVKPAAASN